MTEISLLCVPWWAIFYLKTIYTQNEINILLSSILPLFCSNVKTPLKLVAAIWNAKLTETRWFGLVGLLRIYVALATETRIFRELSIEI